MLACHDFKLWFKIKDGVDGVLGDTTKSKVDDAIDFLHHVGEHDPDGNGLLGKGLLIKAWSGVVDYMAGTPDMPYIPPVRKLGPKSDYANAMDSRVVNSPGLPHLNLDPHLIEALGGQQISGGSAFASALSAAFPMTGALSNMLGPSVDDLTPKVTGLTHALDDLARSISQTLEVINHPGGGPSASPGIADNASSHAAAPATQPVTVTVNANFDHHDATNSIARKMTPAIREVHKKIKDHLEGAAQQAAGDRAMAAWGMD